MSKGELSHWLMSQRSDFRPSRELDLGFIATNTKTIAIASGKGGVGKTTASLMLAKQLVNSGKKVLLIDCDYNLSNTAVKLGLPLNDNFYSLLSMEKSFSECLHKDGNLHLLSGCNGNSDLFDKSFEHDRFIIDVISEHGNEYDFILLDCPAGIGKETVNLAAYADHRFMIVNPDRSSITDTYALIKILKQKYSVSENHLVVNRVSSQTQYLRVVKSLMDTVSTFLEGQLRVLGPVKFMNTPVDEFDRGLRGAEKNSLHKYFSKIVHKFTDESTGLFENVLNSDFKPSVEQEVQPTL
ncbi:AAA family ATPase [Bacteriovorax sp. DB6_IX]|uniref:AAA family ATPase n=1 Tax=Bacteriovorax sp. DB6_IX TaxID=1353530 RepID=UPI000389E773|nr:AAA family ATPase [Bacteriovorax sp. DB6_IX]EQC51513.1 VirC1-like protein [Bacteriovorax sp. DB6_IX]